jgi:hypothetical protein
MTGGNLTASEDERERRMLDLAHDRTLGHAEIARRLGLSKERVRRSLRGYARDYGPEVDPMAAIVVQGSWD